jgi:hypothetical protein
LHFIDWPSCKAGLFRRPITPDPRRAMQSKSGIFVRVNSSRLDRPHIVAVRAII